MRASAATATFSLTLRAVDSRASFWLEPGGQLWVGRHPTNDVVIDGPAISRFHASIRWDADAERPVLCDANSANGTRVDGVRIRGQEPVVLHGGEELAFAGKRFEVDLVHEGVAAPALLTDDSSEVLLFSDHGPTLEGYVWNRESLLRKLLQLEDERRTGTFVFNDGEHEAQLTVCMGAIVSAVAGELRGTPAVRHLTTQARGYYSFSRSFEPVEAELELSLRELLTLEQDETRRMRRGGPEAEGVEAGPNGTLWSLKVDEVWSA
ncbi:MAG: FHA domain-containing protein [Planctomycetes bacterium]|nr:FHA domain-containing protein [Planctomycetota bacterium]